MRRRTLIIAGALLVAVGVAVGVGIYFVIRLMSYPPEDTAKFLPMETSFYVSMNLRPGPGQVMKAKDIRGRFKENPKFQEKLDELYADIEEETGINVEKDLFPWLGPEISMAIPSFKGVDETPGILAFIGTTDKAASESFMRKIIASEESQGTEYEEGKTRGYLTFVGETAYIALTDDFVVIASDSELFESTLDRMDSGQDRQPSRFDKPGFQDARDAAQSPRFGIMYLDVAGIIDQVEGGLDEEIAETLKVFGDNLPDFVVASSAFIDKGISVSMSFDIPDQPFVIGSPNSLGSAGLAPEDTVGLLSFVGILDAWEKIKEEIEDSGYYEVDEVLQEIESEIGLDVEQDIIGWMTGELAFGMLIPSGVSLGFDQIHANVYVEFDDRAKALSSMGEIQASLEEAGVEFTETDLRGTDAVTMDLGDDQGEFDLSPGYVVLDDYVVIGTTMESLEKAVETGRGDTPSLWDSSAFSRPLAAVGDSTDFMMYGNIKRIVEIALEQLDETDLEEYTEEAAPFVDPLEAFLMGASFEEDRFTFSAVVTFD